MVSVLGVTSLASPAETDVYTLPHKRMRQLVSTVTELLPEIQASLHTASEQLLQAVYATMWELKTHEIIENQVIMEQLKARLVSRQVYNHPVCNCHEDSELLEIIDLVEFVHGSSSPAERLHYWTRLQEILATFLDDFLPHMEEEESTVQPLLNQYFDTSELKVLKETVIREHLEWRERVDNEKRLITQMKTSAVTASEEHSEVDRLPDEILLKIFSTLSDPRDLGRVGRVCRQWRTVARAPQLWRSLPLSAWEAGSWCWQQEQDRDHSMASLTAPGEDGWEEEESLLADRVLGLLQAVGGGVRRLSWCGSSRVSSLQLGAALQCLPGLQQLDCSHTRLSVAGLAGRHLRLPALARLDLSGCTAVTDSLVQLLVQAVGSSGGLTWLSLSGCDLLTDCSLAHLQLLSASLQFLDVSGCCRMTGPALTRFTAGCPDLLSENIYYCNLIEGGPDPLNTNGCENIGSNQRKCCINYQD